jgi:hypothetical protein
MTRWGRGFALLAAFLLLPLLGEPVPARAGEQTAEADKKLRNHRRSELRDAAGKWITHRVRFPSRCPLCQGSGRVPGKEGRRLVLKECPQCKGRGAWVSPKDYRIVYYDMKTPAFQSLPGIQEALESQYKAANTGAPWPTRIPRYRIRSWELVDTTHGIVWFLYADARTPTATYWIWSESSAGKGQWYSYDSRSDGPWPDDVDQGPTPSPASPGGWEPVNPMRVAQMRSAAASAKISFRVVEFQLRGDVLRARLEPWDTDARRDSVPAIAGDAMRLLPALLAVGTWASVETEWRTPWRNADGDQRLLPTWIASLQRSALMGRDWSALSTAEKMTAIVWTLGVNAGWQPAAEKPVAPPPPAPTEEDDSTPPAGEPRAPPVQAPPPPLPTEPEPPAPGPLPDLTTSVRGKAEKGVAHIKELFDLARKAHDDGITAHKGGAHDLWQEKLREARAHLSEIETVWRDEVVAVMPGKDEMDRDAVANENFGSMWNEIYQLKAMIRKMSTLGG